MEKSSGVKNNLRGKTGNCWCLDLRIRNRKELRLTFSFLDDRVGGWWCCLLRQEMQGNGFRLGMG